MSWARSSVTNSPIDDGLTAGPASFKGLGGKAKVTPRDIDVESAAQREQRQGSSVADDVGGILEAQDAIRTAGLLQFLDGGCSGDAGYAHHRGYGRKPP